MDALLGFVAVCSNPPSNTTTIAITYLQRATTSLRAAHIHLLCLPSPASNVVISFCFHTRTSYSNTALAESLHTARSALSTHNIPAN